MAILERHIQKVSDENAYREWERKWAAIERRVDDGYPRKRRYSLIADGDDSGTMVWEREWESFAAIEAYYKKLFQDSEAQSLATNHQNVIRSERTELYGTFSVE